MRVRRRKIEERQKEDRRIKKRVGIRNSEEEENKKNKMPRYERRK